MAFTAKGSRISSAARVKGHKKDAIIDWIQDAGDHAEAVEEVLPAGYQIERGQLDGLWAYVYNTGKKELLRNRPVLAFYHDRHSQPPAHCPWYCEDGNRGQH